jgi:hypothetical protein
VKHSADEYVRYGTNIHSNTVEGVFSLLERGVVGTFHSISRKHLPNYLNEFKFRHDTRKVNDGERVSMAVKRVEGRRLKYRESVDKPALSGAGRSARFGAAVSPMTSRAEGQCDEARIHARV